MQQELTGFDWDKGNTHKSWVKHGVSIQESEEIFFNQPVFIAEDEKHSQKERRYFALGITNNERHLFVAYVIRKSLIRIISARDMSKKERREFRECQKENT